MGDSTANQKVSSEGFGADEEAALREALKRCSSETVEAACSFRKRNDPSFLPSVVLGIIERFLEPELRPKLKEKNSEDLRVMEDLGIDSLTLMEIVFLVEETLQVSIDNDEVRELRTVGDVKLFIDHKARGIPVPKKSRFLPIEQLAQVMPQQPPFLFLQEARIDHLRAEASYRISGEEFFLEGHFRNNPVFPASILLEALGQLGVLYLLEGKSPELEGAVDANQILFTSCEGVRCHRVCRPGDTLRLSVKPLRIRAPFATFEGWVHVGQEKAAFAEEITLTFGYCGTEPANSL